MSPLPELETRPWGRLPGGPDVSLFTLRTPGGLSVRLGEYGARLLRVQAPDRHGALGDVLLGHPDLAPYLHEPEARYFGALIGRVANRIAHGTFTLGGAAHRLARNDPPHHLHGGPGGFHAVRWVGTPFSGNGERGVEFRRLSPDGEEGYPGALQVTARYTLTDAGVLAFEAWATTDRLTPVNLTTHAYWNLADGGAGGVLGHTLQLNSARFLAVDGGGIPEAVADAAGTPFDFQMARALGKGIEADHPQLRQAGGYDHHFLLPGAPADAPLRWAATLHDPASGRRVEVSTTEPGLQVYTGNVMDGSFVGWNAACYGQHSAVCLEPQQAPDSVNQPVLDDIILHPGQTYHTRTEWRFSAQ
ncbi:aldose epimerase family protein [Deinococcus aerophilus]|uniref:Aldose 1-epimerase n=1 Tax=Deinococcus aerophilus TaxID=522488 RepID=A0ABQ2GUW2_9DEIO|nr:aldose epimerase family protein [Deinococcus aerophilus]GGM14452.1 aldose 1-epimerase [Deinococcus aerophilus]